MSGGVYFLKKFQIPKFVSDPLWTNTFGVL